jgi:hypothetical protein
MALVDGGLPPALSSSVIAGRRARLNNCWSIVSKSQPSDAMTRTNQWSRVSSRYHGPDAVTGGVDGSVT